MESTRNKLVRVKISSIVLYDEPIKEWDLTLFEKLKKTLKKRGQIKNIVICESENGFECLEGSKIVKALKEIGQDSIIAYNLGVLSEEDKKVVRIELFKDFFLTNYVQVGKLLKEISQTIKLDEVCNTIPFDLRQAKHLISMHEFDWDDFNNNKQIEGQNGLFDLIEEAEVVSKTVESAEKFLISEKVDTEKFVEQGLDELSKIKTEPTKEIENIEVKTEPAKEIFELINETNQQEDDSIFVDDLGKESESVNESIEDKAFNDLIDGKTQVIKEESKIETITNTSKQKQQKIKSITNNNNQEIFIDDEVEIQTIRRGIIKIKIQRISERYVYYFDLETKKESFIECSKFIESSTLPIESESIESGKPVSEKPVNVTNELPEDKEFDERYGKAYEKATEELVKEMEELLDSEPDEVESIETGQIESEFTETIESEIVNENFYFEEKSKLVIIKNYSELVMTGLQKLCLEYAKEKFKQDFTKCEIEHKILTNGEVHIVCVSCITKFSNKISFKQEYIIDVLNKIDSNLFSKYQIKTNDFYYDYQKKVLVLINNKEIIIQNIPAIAQQILENKYNQKTELDKIRVTTQYEGQNVIISHIGFKTEFGVSFRVLLTDVGEFLMKIDFDLN
jgi:hypothetical protein